MAVLTRDEDGNIIPMSRLLRQEAKPKRSCNRSSHDELCKRAEKWLLNTMKCGFAFRELRSIASEQPDAIGWNGGFATYLVECKTSRSDFKKDAEKFFRRKPERGMGMFRYMMCPPDLIKPDELPEGWGLLYCYPKRIKKVVESQEHERSMRDEMTLMSSALRRLQQGGELRSIYKEAGNHA